MIIVHSESLKNDDGLNHSFAWVASYIRSSHEEVWVFSFAD